MWITLEQALPLQRGSDRDEGKSQKFGYNFVDPQNPTEERRLAMNKRSKLDFSGQPIYIGLDVHKKSWSVSIFTQHGEYKTFSQPSEAEILSQYLRHHFPGAQYRSVYEAGYCGFWIHDELKDKGIQNIVVNPADIPTRDKERRTKRDRVDCRKLARGLRGDEIQGIYTPPRWKLEDRSLTRTRLSMGRKQARCKNQIKSMLLFYGVLIPERREMGHGSRRFIRWIEGIRMERASGDLASQIHVEELCHMRQILAKLNRAILALARTEQ
jgi:transposase